MKTYDKFLAYYDEIVRGMNSPIEDEVDFLLKDVIEEYKPETKTVLEFACGTGVIAKELITTGLEVSGVDINENMLKKAKKNFGNNSLYLGDMRTYRAEKQFDMVLCNYNSVCHLLTWTDWEIFFQNACNHLDTGGLFVFDINTLFEFETITRDFAQFYNFWDNTVCLEMFKKTGYYQWLVKIFEKQEDQSYTLTQEIVSENSFAVSKIEKYLKSIGFKIKEKIDYHHGEVTVQSERVYFICEKK